MDYKDKKLPENTMGIIVACSEDGNMSIMVGHNFTESFDKNAAHDFEMILDGLNYMLKYNTEFMHQLGEMSMYAEKGLTAEEQEMMDEYDRQQAGEPSDNKVINFPKNRLN